MIRQQPGTFFIFILLLTALACNAFAGNVEPALEPPPPTLALTLEPAVTTTPPGNEAAPTVTLLATIIAEQTAEPIAGAFVTVLVDLNVRTGPGVQYERVGFLLQGERAPILGVDEFTGWWKVECPPRVLEGDECWLSSGTEYSQAANTEGVPVAAAPPTPIPTATSQPVVTPLTTAEFEIDRPVAAADRGLVVYADRAGLWLIPLDLSQDPPAAAAAEPLDPSPNIRQPLISPDGEKVAFFRRDDEGQILSFLHTNGRGGSDLVDAATLPVTDDSADIVRRIAQMQWLPDSTGLAFNTQLVNQTGPGVVYPADLWTVTLDGVVTERFAPGDGGDTFALAPGGAQVIFGLPEQIVEANFNGRNRRELLTFPFVNTASEYAYAPSVQWLANGRQALTAVAGPDPWQADAGAALYRLQNGTAVKMGEIAGNILFSPIYWHADGANLAYIQLLSNSSSEQALIIAEGNGAQPDAYRMGPNLRLFGWNPADSHLLYAGEDYFGVGQPDGVPVEVSLPTPVRDGQWLQDGAYILSLGSGSQWNLTSGNLAGDTVILATGSGNMVDFDAWGPR